MLCAANSDVGIEILDMLRSKVLEMKDQLALIQPPGEVITDIEPTSAQLTSMFPLSSRHRVKISLILFPATAAAMATQPLVPVKKEPLEEALTSTADYSTSM